MSNLLTSPIIVTGLGRCGSSLVMDMLSKSGIPMLGNAQYPSYELNSNSFGILDSLIVEKNIANDKNYAVKILHPPYLDRINLKKYRVILLERNFKQQALSQIKLLNAMGYQVNLTPFLRLLIKDFKILESQLKYCVSITIDFEDLIINPTGSAKRIADFIGNTDSVELMANCVIPRSTDCFDGFLELTQTRGLVQS